VLCLALATWVLLAHVTEVHLAHQPIPCTSPLPPEHLTPESPSRKAEVSVSMGIRGSSDTQGTMLTDDDDDDDDDDDGDDHDDDDVDEDYGDNP
jgi:hypothetical protein